MSLDHLYMKCKCKVYKHNTTIWYYAYKIKNDI